MRPFVIIPAYNEAKHLGDVIARTKKFCKDIIVVDDGSRDETSAVCRAANVVVLAHIVNLGKGAALKTGCDFAVSRGADILIALDADGQHDPEEIPHFLAGLQEGNSIVFGIRQFNHAMPLVLRFGNMAISLCANLLYHVSLPDTQCGYRAFTKEAYAKIRWSSSDYSMESEMIAKAGRQRLKYSQIPIKTVYSDKYKGTTVLDGIRIVINMVFWWFRFVI
ncbi:MAG TPA: glycosyltransferase family 2 protein [Candidatus Nanoarchaeia archaeon]|nr:glycosyltransferase family 2 protein [Candidatus Nanoarchaeia archaeon]